MYAPVDVIDGFADIWLLTVRTAIMRQTGRVCPADTNVPHIPCTKLDHACVNVTAAAAAAAAACLHVCSFEFKCWASFLFVLVH
jgi:hypothetical protein